MNAIATEEIFPAEDDFASAVFPGAVLGRFIKGNVTASDSSKDCIEAICATLQEYNFHPCFPAIHRTVDKHTHVMSAGIRPSTIM